MGNPITSAIGTGIGLATGSTLGGFLSGQGLDAITSGGSSGTAQPNVKYGTGENTYTIGGKPVDTSKYFITGDKGVYNLLPMLKNAYQDTNRTDFNTGSYDTYNTISQQLANDPTAQQAFQQAFQVQSLNPYQTSGNKPNYRYDTSNLPSYLKIQRNAMMQGNKAKQSYVPQAMNYVDFGFGGGDQLSSIANYASKQNNPFFLAYAPTTTNTQVAPADTGILANNSTGANNV